MGKFKGAVLQLIAILIVCSGSVYSQINLNVKVSASNLLRYGVGKENSVTGDNTKKYFEELGDVRLFVDDFYFGARFEYDDPIEYGKGTKGISRRFFDFTKFDFNVRAGNFYELFAKGLTLNAFESRPIGWNTEFDGLKVHYKNTFGKKRPVKLDATLLGGGINYTDFLDTNRTEVYSIRAGNFAVSPLKPITIGGSYLYTDGQLPTGTIITNIHAEIFEGNFGFNYKGLDLFASYANKVTISDPNAVYPQSQAPRGDGGYGAISYIKGMFGLTIDYKNYRFNLTAPDQRSATNPFKALPFQNAPSCIKEYSSTLLSRFPHNVDFNDEVGWQVDAYYSLNKDLTFNANASLTSRHYDYKDIDTTANIRYERIERDLAFLPSTEDPFSPYWELYLGAEYYWNDNLITRIAFARKTNTLYSINDPGSSDKIRSLTIPIEVDYTFSKIYTLKVVAEFQSAYNSLRAGDKEFHNQNTLISFSRSPDLIISGNFELTDDEEDPSGKKYWIKGELTYKFNSQNQVIVSYGGERGGIQCSSGICRYVNPFNGFRLTLINNFN